MKAEREGWHVVLQGGRFVTGTGTDIAAGSVKAVKKL